MATSSTFIAIFLTLVLSSIVIALSLVEVARKRKYAGYILALSIMVWAWATVEIATLGVGI